MRWSAIVWLCGLSLVENPTPSIAQTAGSTVRILSVRVEGTRFADPQTVVLLSGLQPGDELQPGGEKIQRALRNLMQRGQFSHAEVLVERVTPAGVALLIRVEEFPRLSQIVIEGERRVSEQRIREALGRTPGDILSLEALRQIRAAIEQLYAKENVTLRVVELLREPTDTAGYARLRIRITEGPTPYVAAVRFGGNQALSADELLGAFEETRPKKWWQFWRSDRFDPKKYQEDKQRLLQLYRRHGFLDAELLRDSVATDTATGATTITVWVSEGRRYHLRNVVIVGNTVFPTEQLQQRLGIRPGELYDAERVEKNLRGNEDQTDVASLYLDNGYLSVEVQKEERRVAPDSVDLVVRIYERQRYRIRRVDIVGNTKTKDKVIRRELYTFPGDYFSRSAIIRSIRALGVLNYFNPEALRPDVRLVSDSEVDLLYRVEERSTDVLNASLGIAQGIGVTGSIGVAFNNFSVTEPLRGGAGQVLTFNWEAAAVGYQQQFTLGFTEPWLFDEPTTVGFNGYDTWYRLDYNLRQTGIALNVGRRFRFPDDYFRGDWQLVVQRNRQSGSQGLYRPGTTTEIALRQTLTRLSFNSLIFPSSGSRVSLTTKWAMGAVGIGTTDYLKLGFSAEFVAPLWGPMLAERLVLYLATEMGYLKGLWSDTTIPAVEFYRMGGSGLGGFNVTPLRGYPDQSIGPVGGGTVMARHTAELRFAATLNPMPIYFLVFAEAGNVWDSLRRADPFALKRSAGVGVRILLLPLGLLGFDYGYGFDPARPGQQRAGWNFHFQLGR
ncbi:MAG: outer membrane protein assembly factor BamA [Candidatus Kapabacteria bacterium]|nr:outer membrane protein assembly factor BamA [Candidatus Kapabacteria bacterium]MDW8012192.1 outer membrane protein assembly factor BamA [Bacteroidota bacterium]